MSWNSLTQTGQLQEIASASHQKPQLVFKHSTRCGTSSFALSELRSGEGSLADTFDLHYLDLLAYRPVSNEIASSWGVPHQSPQVIVLQDGKAVFSLSHMAISVNRILERLSSKK